MAHAAYTASDIAHASPLRISTERLRRALLWLMVASSSIVLVEPAPYDVLFLCVAVVFVLSGMRFPAGVAPLLLLVTTFNIGGALSLIPFLDHQPSVMFVIISIYMGFSAVFFACLMAEDTENRLEIISKAWIFAGVISSLCGFAGYMNLAGTGEIFTLYGRVTGTFKDPNVFGPFLMAPAVLIVQGFMAGTLRHPIRSFVYLMVLLGGIFFSFSRGAWGAVAMAFVMTGLLLFVTTRSTSTRMRIVVIAIAGVAVLALALAAILSIDSVHELFEVRASLKQDYDTGVHGRFGKLLDAIPMLLDRPNGFGPLRFTDYFPEAPHDVFVNAFSSYGWLGGISYFCLVLLTVWLGWSTVWRRTPWQGTYIALWSVTFGQILQGFQIDTDHWRHLWLLFGLVWGLAIVSKPRRRRRRAVRPAPASAAAQPAADRAFATSR
ncbi:MAG: O-antigen ligase family protein [Variibacter sp.]